MTRDEFMAAAVELVGAETGTLGRFAELLGVSRGYVYRISQGLAAVPAHYAERVEQARAQAGRSGAAVPFLAPRLVRAVRAAEEAGWSRGQALAAVAAWAGLALSETR